VLAAYLYGAKDLRLKETGTPEINDNEISISKICKNKFNQKIIIKEALKL